MDEALTVRYDRQMRVGVYVDGYNLYYGGKSFCDPTDSWKWFSPRALAENALNQQLAYAVSNGLDLIASAWEDAVIERVVYCTARISGVQSPSAASDQAIYLTALERSDAVDHIEYGNYVTRLKYAPLAVRGPGGGGAPVVKQAAWPVMVQDSQRQRVEGASFLVSHLHTEEKGSDVNVATHLLVDVFSDEVDAAIVISNDSDLGYPVSVARGKVPVGVINPRNGATAGKLRPPGEVGSTHHWGRKLRRESYLAAQLPEEVEGIARPSSW